MGTYALKLLHGVVASLPSVVENEVGHIDVAVWSELLHVELCVQCGDADRHSDVVADLAGRWKSGGRAWGCRDGTNKRSRNSGGSERLHDGGDTVKRWNPDGEEIEPPQQEPTGSLILLSGSALHPNMTLANGT